MGRITEFIDYINQKYEPTALEKKSDYSHITFTSKVEKLSKDYRKQMKKENNK